MLALPIVLWLCLKKAVYIFRNIYTKKKEKSYQHFFTSLFITSLFVSTSMKSNLVLELFWSFSMQMQQLFWYKIKKILVLTAHVLNHYRTGTVLNALHASSLWSSQPLDEVGTIIIPILQMKKLSTKLSNKLCDGGIKSLSLNSNPADSRAHTIKILQYTQYTTYSNQKVYNTILGPLCAIHSNLFYSLLFPFLKCWLQ